ncbi:MAG TPA: hypothetical protein VNV15_09245 [Opitutaceae bacterium]|jgi:hypothetical protein|nr:hypothetical protein [Opitutaceae bacterium]
MNLSQKLAENHQSLVSLDERIRQAEFRRDYPPLGSCRLDSVIQEELRVLYVGHAKLLQHIDQLEQERVESDFAENFQSVLETARLADEHAARKSGHPSFIRHLFPGNRESQSF